MSRPPSIRGSWTRRGGGRWALTTPPTAPWIQAGDIARRCGILTTYGCTPYLSANIPLFGENCAWAETSACLYINSMLGARSNRESFETALYSALLGITPNFGMHLDRNRKGTHLIDV